MLSDSFAAQMYLTEHFFLVDQGELFFGGIMDKIVSGDVISLHGYVVYVETDIALPGGVVVRAVLPFGPFSALGEAEAWSNILAAIRAHHLSIEQETAEKIHEQIGLPTSPYLVMHVAIHMISSGPDARRNVSHLYAPETPEIAEGKLAYYALNTVREAVIHSLTLVEP